MGKNNQNTLYQLLLLSCMLLCVLPSCKKMIEIPPPAVSITTSQVFADSSDASSGIAGIYYVMAGSGSYQPPLFGNGGISIYCGSSSDELVPFNPGSDGPSDIYRNAIKPTNSITGTVFWSSFYSLLYQINSTIEAVNGSTGLSTNAKKQFIGEAKFMRAYLYFYLTNLYGDVPLILSSNYHHNTNAKRSTSASVYQQIISDLTDAQTMLRADYSISNNERIRANKSAATALLARVYLYTSDWKGADSCASVLINDGRFNLAGDLNDVFLSNSAEAIFQWKINTSLPPYNATGEGDYLIPGNNTSPPNYYLSDQLLSSFEPGDMRKIKWLDSTTYSGTVYYYPYKYKIGPSLEVPNSTPTESYMVLRLGEQYLIRAEAEAHGAGAGISGAISDLNSIRSRAGLGNYAGATDQASLLNAIYHERQVELFAEWGQRWLDLKRVGIVDSVMSVITPLKNGGNTWNSYQKLYPIPYSDLLTDPNLTQNPGY